MDKAAELTLQIVCYLQGQPDSPRSPREWVLIPGYGRGPAPFPEAIKRLGKLEKPLLIGALSQPGYVAVWLSHQLDSDQLRHVDHTLRNQQNYLASKLRQLECENASRVLFEGWGSSTFMSATALNQWLGEYALTWGWTIGPPSDDTHQARLIVVKDGRRWSPGGDVCSTSHVT